MERVKMIYKNNEANSNRKKSKEKNQKKSAKIEQKQCYRTTKNVLVCIKWIENIFFRRILHNQ